MKFCLAIGLLIVGAKALAIECGPTMRAASLSQMEEAVDSATTKLLQQSIALLEEMGRSANARSDSDLSAFGKISNESDRISNATTAGERVQDTLNTNWILATIRDQMLDARDKARVNAYLSIALANAKRRAESASKSLAATLSTVTRPGIAVDVAKLRDTIDVVIKAFEKCVSPIQAR